MTEGELEKEIGISHGFYHSIFCENCDMKRVSSKLVPNELELNKLEKSIPL